MRGIGETALHGVRDEQALAKAENLRLEMELGLGRRGVDNEVVLLEAASEEALRRTHRRYFETPRQIANSASSDSK